MIKIEWEMNMKDLCEYCGIGIEEAPGGCGCKTEACKTALHYEIEEILMNDPIIRNYVCVNEITDELCAYIEGLLNE